MANHKSAKKRILVSAKRKVINKASASKMKTLIKKVYETEDKVEAEGAYKEAVSYIDKVAAKGRLHKNNAGRKKSALTTYVNKLSVPAEIPAS